MTTRAAGAAPAAGPVRAEDFDSAASLDSAARALEQAAHGRGPIAVMLRVPRIDPIPLFFSDTAVATHDDAFYWRDREGTLLAGAGVAVELRGTGVDRFRDLAERAAAICDVLTAHAPDPVGTPPPRFFGGLAFAPGAADAAEWGGLGDARFVLPELGYMAERDEAWLSLALGEDARSSGAARTAALERLETTLEQVAALAQARGAGRGAAEDEGGPATELPHLIDVEDAAGDAHYEELVRGALEAIRSGVARKIVVARRAQGRLDGEASVDALLDRLRRAVGAFRYAIHSGDALFVGASPERLAARRGGIVQTEAVAGTAALDDEEPLETRDKDRREQELVVRAIAETLSPLCACLSYDPAPQERRVGPVRHLATTFECRLRDRPHVLTVLEALHPTPAVGGWPTDAALRWIHEHEAQPRGWYASPVGWFDAAGDGEFAVALRCGLLRGDTLDLFAGAGIVAGSDAVAERDETRLKLRALPEALGIAR